MRMRGLFQAVDSSKSIVGTGGRWTVVAQCQLSLTVTAIPVCSSETFEAVAAAVGECASVASPLPVVLSMEMHWCGKSLEHLEDYSLLANLDPDLHIYSHPASAGPGFAARQQQEEPVSDCFRPHQDSRGALASGAPLMR